MDMIFLLGLRTILLVFGMNELFPPFKWSDSYERDACLELVINRSYMCLTLGCTLAG